MLRLLFRRGLSCALLILLYILFISGNAQALFKEGSETLPPQRIIANELIVKFKPGTLSSSSSSPPTASSLDKVTSSNLEFLMSKYGVSKIEELKSVKRDKVGISSLGEDSHFSGVYKLTLSNLKGSDIRQVAQEFTADPETIYAEPNYVFQIFKYPNDPYYGNQWGLSKVGAAGGWDALVGDPDIVIAVIDTGIDYNHSDLASNIWTNSDEIGGNGIDDDGNGYIDDVRGWDFVSVPPDWVWPGEDSGPEDADPFDFVGHGTHVAGIAAGRTNNSMGTAGMTWNCKIMPIRAGYAASDGYGYLEYFDAGRAIIYAADNGADVINMSWGGLADSSFLYDAITHAWGKGSLLVASAGNVISEYATIPYYPAAYPEVVAVSATDEDDMLSIWNWFIFSNFGDWVDICAPGSYILSTLPGGTYGYYSGTSMSAPFVAGLAALIKAKYPYFTSDQIVQRIKDTADDIDSKNPGFLAGQLGAGRINAHRALGSILIGIGYPKSGSKVGSKMMIKGSANVENFLSYKLEYGASADPNIWMPIGLMHTAPVDNGALENWDATGLFGEYTIKLTVTDISGESYVATSKVNISETADVKLIGAPLPGPNPFNPSAHLTTKIYYELGTVPAGGVDIDVCIYDITGTLIWRRTKHSSGAEVVDDLCWDGRNAFGEQVGNGVYPFFLIAGSGGDKKIIGRSKIAVIR